MKISKVRIQKALTQAETFRFNGVIPRKPKKVFRKSLISRPLGWISIMIQEVVRRP